jgi:uncharacterized protein
MLKDKALRFFEAHKQEIIERFGVKHLALFGSTVRNEAREDSNIDVLVEFESGETYRNNFDLQFYLEDPLHRPIDLICMDAGLRSNLISKKKRSMSRKWKLYFDDLVGSCEKAMNYTQPYTMQKENG